MIETPQAFLNKYQGQSLLYNKADPSLIGQCVQSVAYYVADNGFPVIWADAAEWWNRRNNRYDYIANTPDAVPQPGDIIIWGGSLPGSGGAGHIAVCLYPLPGIGTFVSVDSNWAGKTVHTVTHNYSYVIGWMRFKEAAPVPAPAPQPAAQIIQGAEMIADTNQAHQAYRLLRPNGDGNADEINATAGKRSWEQFAADAQGEVNQRNANIQAQEQHMADMQNVINSTNQAVTDLRATIANADVTNADKQKALDDALKQIANDNAQITTLHDQVADLQKRLANPVADASAAIASAADTAKQKAGKSSGFAVAFFKFLLTKVPHKKA